MTEDWRSLRVGDRIRIVHMPSDWDRPDWRVDPSTRRLYQRLIDRKRSVRIARIDEYGIPWIAGFHDEHERKRSGGSTHWFLGINHEGWVRVQHRAAQSKRN